LTLRPGKSSRKAGTKGQLYGYAIKIKTGKPWVAKPDRKTCYATGQNNSNPTPYAASRKLGDQPTKQPLISAEISRVRESERNRATYATHGYRVEDGISHGHVTDRTPMNLKRTSR
jgi:hypothetical protein